MTCRYVLFTIDIVSPEDKLSVAPVGHGGHLRVDEKRYVNFEKFPLKIKQSIKHFGNLLKAYEKLSPRAKLLSKKNVTKCA